MTKILITVWALVMVQLSLWTYYAPSPRTSVDGSQTSDSAAAGSSANVTPTRTDAIESLKAQESYKRKGRELRIKSAIEGLSLPWSMFCNTEGRKTLLGSTGGYLSGRYNDVRSALDTYGPEGAKFVAELHMTTADNQIERLIQEAYTNGYIKPDDFKPKSFERLMLIEILKNEKVRGKGCG